MSNNNSNRNVILATAAGLATASALSLIRSGAHADLLPSLTFNTLGKPFNPISGYVKPGYEPVLEAYRSNFTRGEEVGSTLCIYVKGEKVLDLAGGWTDTTRTKPYSQETVNVTFSSGKAVMVFLCLYAISQGWFKLDEKIVDIWPEFGKGGKEGVKVEDVMAHRGGVAFMEGAFNTVGWEAYSGGNRREGELNRGFIARAFRSRLRTCLPKTWTNSRVKSPEVLTISQTETSRLMWVVSEEAGTGFGSAR